MDKFKYLIIIIIIFIFSFSRSLVFYHDFNYQMDYLIGETYYNNLKYDVNYYLQSIQLKNELNKNIKEIFLNNDIKYFYISIDVEELTLNIEINFFHQIYFFRVVKKVYIDEKFETTNANHLCNNAI